MEEYYYVKDKDDDEYRYAVKPSAYGLKNGYLDYKGLADLIGPCILNNFLVQEIDDFEPYSGGSNPDDEATDEIFQWYIITDRGAELLSRLTNEQIWYSEKLNMYLWGVDHFGTTWDYVLTNLPLIKKEE